MASKRQIIASNTSNQYWWRNCLENVFMSVKPVHLVILFILGYFWGAGVLILINSSARLIFAKL